MTLGFDGAKHNRQASKKGKKIIRPLGERNLSAKVAVLKSVLCACRVPWFRVPAPELQERENVELKLLGVSQKSARKKRRGWDV